jgi:tetratricopeptide (TPR) repeat protein
VASAVDQQPSWLPYREELEGRWKLVEVHLGGMGEVLIVELGEDAHERLALKSFQKRLFFDAASRSAFIREATVWSRLAGVPHVMPAVGMEYLDDRPFVRMPAIGTTLRQLLSSGPLAPEDAATAAVQIAIGMDDGAARVEGLVHGDLKPENVFLAPAGLLISDFGLARAGAEPALHLASTWAYRAPECWEDPLATSTASDIYAFGVILWELFFGTLPFEADGEDEWMRAHRDGMGSAPPTRSAGGLGAAVTGLAARCLAKDRAERPQAFQAIRRALFAALHEWDPIQTLMVGYGSAQLAERGAAMRSETALERVHALVELGEHEAALGELDALGDAGLTDELLVERGNVLSLGGRDEEAIAAFREVLEREPEEDVAIRCRVLLGLSLKRLSLYDEALAIYHRLLETVPDSMLVEVTGNLATVLLAKGDAEEAVSRLKPLATAHPERPELWGNLAFGYRDLGEFDEAVAAFQRCIAAAPYRGDLQVAFAAMLLEDLGAVGAALSVLELAGQQGETTASWYVRTRACYRLLEMHEADAGVRELAERDLPPETVEELESEIDALVATVRERDT